MTKQELIKFIKNFDTLTDEEAQLIVDNTNVQAFKKGTLLLQEGQVAKYCYLVLKGCVREYYLVDGIEKSTAFFTEGQPVTSFTSFSNQTPSKHYLVCAEDCILTLGTQETIDDMSSKIPGLESIILQEVEKTTGQAQDEFAAFVISSPEERYLNLLETRPDLLNRIPQHQIASYLGITPESLSRIKKRIVSKLG